MMPTNSASRGYIRSNREEMERVIIRADQYRSDITVRIRVHALGVSLEALLFTDVVIDEIFDVFDGSVAKDDGRSANEMFARGPLAARLCREEADH